MKDESLLHGTNNHLWTINSSLNYNNGTTFAVKNNVLYKDPCEGLHIKPVAYLKANAQYYSGEGTIYDPYTLKP